MLQPSVRFNAFNNYIISVFFLFLPFTYALTFKIGFPLKISEIAIFIIFTLLLLKSKFNIYIQHQLLFKVVSAFILIAFISTSINLLWSYDYRLTSYESRFGYQFDSILKFVYLVIAYIAWLISANAFCLNEKIYINCLIYGAVLASIYSWYLFITSLLKLPFILLPGMDELPQTAALSVGTVIRSGTFKEGNFMGLFLLIAAFIALYAGKNRTFFYLIFSLVTTVSSMAFICGFLFILLHYFKKYFTQANIIKLLFFFALVAGIFMVIIENKDFRLLITSKFFGSTGSSISNNAEYSRADRLNSTKTAINIGLHNPFIGVGLSNYALHLKEYNTDTRVVKENFKGIANNIYAEIFAELGFTGLLLFCFMLYLLYRQTRYDRTGILRRGFLVTLLYFLAFPTFTVLFLWIFWSLISSLPITYAASNN